MASAIGARNSSVERESSRNGTLEMRVREPCILIPVFLFRVLRSEVFIKVTDVVLFAVDIRGKNQQDGVGRIFVLSRPEHGGKMQTEIGTVEQNFCARDSIEHANGCEVVQYRNNILRLVSLRAVLEPGTTDDDQADPVQVIVFNDGGRSLGVVVDKILDVAEEAVTVRQKSSREGLLGSALVGKRVTDFLDLNQVIRAASESWFQSTGETANGKNILVAEGSAFSRCLTRSGLDMAGYRVMEAANLDEAVRCLEREPVDVVVTELELPPGGSTALLAAMRLRPEWDGISVLALADSAEQLQTPSVLGAGYQDCQAKFDQEAMLESIARLASAVASADSAPVHTGEVS